jgi:DNA-binding NarL/FixJ family response regulator
MRPPRTPKRKTRILLADREGVFRLGLKRLLALEDDLRVVAQTDSLDLLKTLSAQFKPDLIFLQAEISSEASGDLIPELKSLLPNTRVVITASTLGDEASMSFVESGASGVILKSVEPALFVKCARKVMENELWLPKKQITEMAQALRGRTVTVRPADTLTRREKTIISYLIRGLRNREIGEHLTITEQTVKNHLRTIYDKVGVSDRLELALYAIHKRLELPEVPQ